MFVKDFFPQIHWYKAFIYDALIMDGETYQALRVLSSFVFLTSLVINGY